MNILFCIVMLFLTSCQRFGYDSVWDFLDKFWSDEINFVDDFSYDELDLDEAFLFISSVAHIARNEYLPSDFVLLPFVFNGYRNDIVGSNAGIWSIHKKNCSSYNLICNNAYDERLHVIKSTLAVIARMSDMRRDGLALVNIFGSYAKENNLKISSESIVGDLSKIKSIIHYDRKNLPFIPEEVFFEEVKVPSAISLSDIADLSNIDKNIWFKLNRWCLKSVSDSNLCSYVFVPVSAYEDVKFPSKAKKKTIDILETGYRIQKNMEKAAWHDNVIIVDLQNDLIA